MSFISILQKIGSVASTVGRVAGPVLTEVNVLVPNPYTKLASAILAGTLGEISRIELAHPSGPGADKIQQLAARIQPGMLPIINAVLESEGKTYRLTPEMLPKFMGLSSNLVSVSNQLAGIVAEIEASAEPLAHPNTANFAAELASRPRAVAEQA